MSLITHGSANCASMKAKQDLILRKPVLKEFTRAGDLEQVTRNEQPVPVDYIVSPDNRGLAIKSITLKEGFEGFLGKLINPTNELFMVAWCWDLSGNPVFQFPEEGFNPQDLELNVEVNEPYSFLGSGRLIFPAQKVTCGINARIIIWESDEGIKKQGKTLKDIADAIKSSKLNNVLNLVNMAAGGSLTTYTTIKDAALELAGIIGSIMQANSNDYVDLFEGFFESTEPWDDQDIVCKHKACEIKLSKLH